MNIHYCFFLNLSNLSFYCFWLFLPVFPSLYPSCLNFPCSFWVWRFLFTISFLYFELPNHCFPTHLFKFPSVSFPTASFFNLPFIFSLAFIWLLVSLAYKLLPFHIAMLLKLSFSFSLAILHFLEHYLHLWASLHVLQKRRLLGGKRGEKL